MPQITRKTKKTTEKVELENDALPDKTVDSSTISSVQPAASVGQWILIAPGSKNNAPSSARNVEFVRLRNPRTSRETVYGFSEGNCEMYELQRFAQGKRSWFIGNSVQSDGSFCIATQIDPLFVVLPYLIKAEYASPLEQLLIDDEYPETSKLIASIKTESLEKVADLKQTVSIQAWKYSEHKTLMWLEKKYTKLIKTLESKSINASSVARSASYVAAEKTSPDDYKRYAFGMLCEYLHPDLGKKLQVHLNLPDVPKDATQEPPAKRIKISSSPNEPIEDYSKMVSSASSQTKDKNVTAKDKARANAAKGSKSITSFFTKK